MNILHTVSHIVEDHPWVYACWVLQKKGLKKAAASLKEGILEMSTQVNDKKVKDDAKLLSQLKGTFSLEDVVYKKRQAKSSIKPPSKKAKAQGRSVEPSSDASSCKSFSDSYKSEGLISDASESSSESSESSESDSSSSSSSESDSSSSSSSESDSSSSSSSGSESSSSLSSKSENCGDESSADSDSESSSSCESSSSESKSDASSAISSDGESSSDSSSSDSSDEEMQIKQNEKTTNKKIVSHSFLKPAPKFVKATGKADDLYAIKGERKTFESDESSSSSAESSSSSESDSSESASNSSSSETESGSESSSDSSSSSSESEEEVMDKKAQSRILPTPNPTPKISPNKAIVKSTQQSGPKKNIPFQRIDANKVVFMNEAVKTHTYDGANELGVYKGKSFRQEKNKKKRGSFRGGPIDQSIRSIKFDSD